MTDHLLGTASSMLVGVLAVASSTSCSNSSPSGDGVDMQTSSASLVGTPISTTHTVSVNGVNLFYREAGNPSAPTIVLLHGFPASSHEYRNLLADLGESYHLVAPDYPGFGFSDAPTPDTFTYTFDNVAELMGSFIQQLGITKYALYVQDYGGPIGFRIATAHPDQITALIIQNAVAYDGSLTGAFAPLQAYWADKAIGETGARGFLTAATTMFQYTQGSTAPERLSPEAWTLDQALLDRPGDDLIQLAMLYDKRSLDADEITMFAAAWDPQPFHLDERAAAATVFGGLSASGWQTALFSFRLVLDSVPIAGGLITDQAHLTWPNATRPGDVLETVAEVVEVVPSRSRADRGRVKLLVTTRNQRGETVFTFSPKLVVQRRSTSTSPT